MRTIAVATILPCKKDCNECRSNITKNTTFHDMCVNVPRSNNMLENETLSAQATSMSAFNEPTQDDEWCQFQEVLPPDAGFLAAEDSPPCEYFETAPFFKAPDVACPCQTKKKHVCNTDLGGVEETQCELLETKPVVTCGYNQATTDTLGMTVCTYCNPNSTCTIKRGQCTETGCTGCKYASDMGACTDCPTLIASADEADGPNRDARSAGSAEDCKAECSECFESGSCVNVYRRNFNNPLQKYTIGSDGMCEVVACEEK